MTGTKRHRPPNHVHILEVFRVWTGLYQEDADIWALGKPTGDDTARGAASRDW